MSDKWANDELRQHAAIVREDPEAFPLMDCEMCMEAWQRGYAAVPTSAELAKRLRHADLPKPPEGL